MKSKFLSFVAGALSALILVGLPVTALASDGALSIRVFPINILVDGKVFQPTDSDGNTAMVFTYNGTTYAPLRALAEAYGLKVGYDAECNTATVTKPDSNSFASSWTITEKPVIDYGNEKIFTAVYSGTLGMSDFKAWWKSLDENEISSAAEKLAAETQILNPDFNVTMYFSYGSYNLGTAYAFGDYEISNFDSASIWIK